MAKFGKVDFNSKEEAISYFKNKLSKQQTANITINGKKYLICGTPMIEDIVAENFIKAFIKTVKELTGKSLDFSNVCDYGIGNDYLVPAFEECLTNVLDTEIIYITTEF